MMEGKYNPDAQRPQADAHLRSRWPLELKRGARSRRYYEKIGDCKQSTI